MISLLLLLVPVAATALPTIDTNVTIHKIDYPVKGNCGEFDMPSKEAHFPVTLGGFKMGDCSVDGYTIANGTKHECSPKVLGKQWCADFELFAKEANLKAGCGFACKSHSDCNGGDCGVCNDGFCQAQANLIFDDNTNVTIHKVDYPVKGECGQFDMPSKEAHFPVTLGGFKMGDCSVDGYTVANGTKHECSPKVLGKQWCADFELFAKTQHFKENLKAGCGFACKSHSDCNGGECGVCNKYGQCWYDATM